jgi:hypothetical protein
MSSETSLRHQLFGAWCGPIFSLLTIIGWLWIAHFWAPAAADASPAETARFFTSTYRDGILLGCSIFLFSCCFLAIWTCQLGIMMWEIEAPAPLWTLTQIVAGAGIVIIVVLDCSFWIAAAYRPAAHPDVIVAMNDAAWLGFLLAWPLLSLQMIATALVMRADARRAPLVPEWLSNTSIAGGVGLVTAAGPAFTHSGPFAFHGVLGFYLPMLIWGGWLNAHAWYMRRHVLRSRDRRGVDLAA